VFSLRHSARDATRIGGRLNALALEIQVHNLEGQQRIEAYLAASPASRRDRKTNLDEARFEISEISSLAARAVEISPTPEKRTKFASIVATEAAYVHALEKLLESSGPARSESSVAAYREAALRLNQSAEDGEAAGRDAAQVSLDEIDSISTRSVALVTAISVLGLGLGTALSSSLVRAILIPVEHLKSVAENVSLGNLNLAVHRYSQDEIGDLTDSFARMVTAVKFFRAEANVTAAAIKQDGAEQYAVKHALERDYDGFT
jgi:methyl-accepting chemotaxis protein